MLACGLDFGTSNSAIGIVRDGAPELAPVEAADTLIPSAIFFDFETRAARFGRDAIDSYIAGHEGRLMRALKSILGSPLIDESTAVGGKRIALTQVVEIFVRHLKTQAERFLGANIDAVVHGRPVHFVDGDAAADARAENVLAQIAHRAGFREVLFLYEPLAAAYHYEQSVTREEIVLVADIGGGTSDFSIIRIGPERRTRLDRRDDILANAGVRIGGTDFDTLLSLDVVMPLLGLGTQLIEKDLPMPKAIYFELANWALINFAYTYKSERDVRELLAQAREPEKVSRLLKTLHQRLGHRIAFTVEDAKIALSDAESARLPLFFLEASLSAEATRAGFDTAIREKTARLTLVAQECIRRAGLRPDQIDTIFFTGGSSHVAAVRDAIGEAAPNVTATAGSDLLSVAYGLTHEAARLFA